MVAAGVIVILVLAAAATGGMFPPGPWYRALNRPSWTPPDWVFPTVWTPLYVMIGYAGWLVWKEANVLAGALWLAQLVFNGLWSFLFFGRRQMRGALLDLLLMQSMVLGFIVVTWSTQPLAALLFVPYAIWVSIAGLLNVRMIQLNPQVRAAG
ncbi:MAG: TspO/MBR family protein [Pseudomonadota bacterium]